MNLEISMQSLKHIFSFPFADPKWKEKFLTGSLLAFGGFVVPVIAWLPLFGYMARMIRAGARNTDPAALPEWDDWGDLFTDGLRLLGATLILMLPAVAVYGLGWLIYMISMVGMPSSGRGSPSSEAVIGFLVGLFIFLLSIGLGTLLTFACSLVMTPAESHVAYHQRFGALFEVGVWWKIFRANWGGFLLTLFLMLGLTMVMTVAVQVMYITIILCLFIPIISAPLYFYTLIIFGRIAGQAYGEGLGKGQAEAQPVLPLPDAA